MATTGTVTVDLNQFRDMINNSSQLGESVVGGVKDQGDLIGLAIGFQKVRLGELAGICLALYFAIAVVTHTRVKDSVKDTLPAFMLCVMSLLYVLTTVAK